MSGSLESVGADDRDVTLALRDHPHAAKDEAVQDDLAKAWLGCDEGAEALRSDGDGTGSALGSPQNQRSVARHRHGFAAIVAAVVGDDDVLTLVISADDFDRAIQHEKELCCLLANVPEELAVLKGSLLAVAAHDVDLTLGELGVELVHSLRGTGRPGRCFR